MAPTLLLSTAAALCCLSLVSSTDYETENHGHKKPHQTNLLFIMFDDLRAELSIYGKSGIISPNFERLAARSVVFDNAYCQISVCNPSRDSLLTGLRPDTVGTYGFQSSYGTYKRHLLLPTRLKRSGYTTAGYGKIRHWDGGDGSVWSENYNGNWYGYQGEEWNFMNSSVMPDKVRAEETFPDYIFASKAIEGLQRLSKLNEYFMVSVGFKMPHLAMHVPYKYYDMYRSRVHQWNATEAELRYPLTSPVVSYRCCADSYHYMNDEGALKSNRTYETRHINDTFPLTVHQEMMWGYAAMVTFVDKQLGRVLDAVDELELWGNLTVVLTSDHGMHNGEKGIWEKWTLFDESTHIPLMIAHPLSPFKGQHYIHPVESIDVFPTINDLLSAPFNKNHIFGLTHDGKANEGSRKFIPLQGKSLAPIVLGSQYRHRSGKLTHVTYDGDLMPSLNHTFAITQSWRCSSKENTPIDSRLDASIPQDHVRWDVCNIHKNDSTETSVMGYSMRTLDFRYTMYIPFVRSERVPSWEAPIFAEELYDHRDGYLGDLGHKETVNVATDIKFKDILEKYRGEMKDFLWHEVVYVSMGTTFADKGKKEERSKRRRSLR